MKILLINPAPKHYTRARCSPLGVLSIASYLNSNGHTAKVLNRAITSTDIAAELDEFKPDFIGCSLLTVMAVSDSIVVSKEAKKRGICVVWGGPYVSASPEMILRLDCVDFISMGEGEETWLELADKKANGESLFDIKGLAFMRDGEFVRTPEREFMDLTKLPPIDYSLIDIQKTFYTNYHYDGIMGMYISKGCNAQCTFCYNHDFHHSCRRSRDIDLFIEEAKLLKEKYGMKAIAFTDEFFGYNKAELHKICNALIEADLGIHWGGMTKIGIFDREDFELMYKAGCRWLEFGVESGAETTLRRMKKGLKLSKVEEDLINCREVGIISLCYFIVGFPGETVEELKETCALVNKIKYTRFVCSYFSPLPGSEIYEKLVSEGKFSPPTELKNFLKSKIFYSPKPNLSEVKTLDLKVVRSYILWSSFKRKSFEKSGKIDYSLAKKDIIDVFKSLRGHGFTEGVIQFFASAYEFLDIFFYANFFPSIRKKYGLDLTPDKE